LDFNLDYKDFGDVLYPMLYQKAGEVYDPMGFERTNLKLKYAWLTKARLANVSQKPLQQNDYLDLDDASDYTALQLDLQTKHSQRTGLDCSLQFHATLVMGGISPRTQQTQPKEDDLGGASDSELPGGRNVSLQVFNVR
jgi:hypothetical protein